jgi:AcrR family transcriptional regulator
VVQQVGEDQPVSARRTHTRDRLMAAALQVFAERGVLGASVEVICEAAGFTRGAFYSNFADKDALVLALLQASTTAQFAAAERSLDELQAASGEQPFEDLVSRAMDRLGSGDQPNRQAVLVQQELMLHAARVPALWAPYTAFLGTRTRQLSEQIERCLVGAGLEFVLPFDQAIEVLSGAHSIAQSRILFGAAMNTTPLRSLILAITRPRSPMAGGPEPSRFTDRRLDPC